MSWREAWNLTGALSKDPSSQVGAALAGWDGPRSAEWLLLADLYDLQHQSKAKRTPKPYPRPLPKKKRNKPVVQGAAAMRALQRLSGVSAPGVAIAAPPAGPFRGPDGRFAKRPV